MYDSQMITSSTSPLISLKFCTHCNVAPPLTFIDLEISLMFSTYTRQDLQWESLQQLDLLRVYLAQKHSHGLDQASPEAPYWDAQTYAWGGPESFGLSPGPRPP